MAIRDLMPTEVGCDEEEKRRRINQKQPERRVNPVADQPTKKPKMRSFENLATIKEQFTACLDNSVSGCA